MFSFQTWHVIAKTLRVQRMRMRVTSHSFMKRSCTIQPYFQTKFKLTSQLQKSKCNICCFYLQKVCKRGGGYVKVPLVEGGILVNIGDLMQRWTSDTYLATVNFWFEAKWRQNSRRPMQISMHISFQWLHPFSTKILGFTRGIPLIFLNYYTISSYCLLPFCLKKK